MGLIHKGIPEAFALELAKKWNLEYFIETGTFTGRTASWAADHFRYVFTIELNEDHWFNSHDALKKKGNVSHIYGDSREFLKSAVMAVPTPALIWLDAHWSRDLGYQRPELGECPVLEELAAIKNDGRPHVILIDDARYFVNPPPQPHKAEQWPTDKQIVNAVVPDWWFEYKSSDDVLLLEPNLTNLNR